MNFPPLIVFGKWTRKQRIEKMQKNETTTTCSLFSFRSYSHNEWTQRNSRKKARKNNKTFDFSQIFPCCFPSAPFWAFRKNSSTTELQSVLARLVSFKRGSRPWSIDSIQKSIDSHNTVEYTYTYVYIHIHIYKNAVKSLKILSRKNAIYNPLIHPFTFCHTPYAVCQTLYTVAEMPCGMCYWLPQTFFAFIVTFKLTHCWRRHIVTASYSTFCNKTLRKTITMLAVQKESQWMG